MIQHIFYFLIAVSPKVSMVADIGYKYLDLSFPHFLYQVVHVCTNSDPSLRSYVCTNIAIRLFPRWCLTCVVVNLSQEQHVRSQETVPRDILSDCTFQEVYIYPVQHKKSSHMVLITLFLENVLR